MPRINVIVDDEMYLKVIKIKSKLQKKHPTKNINFTDAVKFVLNKGLGNT